MGSDGEAEYGDEEADEEEVEDDDDDEDEEAGEEAKADGKKRTRGQQNGSNKSQKDNSGKGQSKSNGSKSSSNGQSKEEETNKSSNKGDKKGTVGSKHMKDEDPAPKGSVDRLPKKGQAAQWKSLPGFVKGKVEDILTEAQEVDGKNVKASEKDPRIVLKSDSSGKIC